MRWDRRGLRHSRRLAFFRDDPQTRHNVESDSSHAPGLDRFPEKPGARTSPQSVLLPGIDSFRWTPAAQGCTGFDFDEDEQWTPACDEVHLDSVGSNVPCDDAISSRFEESSGNLFTRLAQTLA